MRKRVGRGFKQHSRFAVLDSVGVNLAESRSRLSVGFDDRNVVAESHDYTLRLSLFRPE